MAHHPARETRSSRGRAQHHARIDARVAGAPAVRLEVHDGRGRINGHLQDLSIHLPEK